MEAPNEVDKERRPKSLSSVSALVRSQLLLNHAPDVVDLFFKHAQEFINSQHMVYNTTITKFLEGHSSTHQDWPELQKQPDKVKLTENPENPKNPEKAIRSSIQNFFDESRQKSSEELKDSLGDLSLTTLNTQGEIAEDDELETYMEESENEKKGRISQRLTDDFLFIQTSPAFYDIEHYDEEVKQAEDSQHALVQAKALEAEALEAKAFAAEILEAEAFVVKVLETDEALEQETCETETLDVEVLEAKYFEAEVCKGEDSKAKTFQVELREAELLEAEILEEEAFEAEALKAEVEAESLELAAAPSNEVLAEEFESLPETEVKWEWEDEFCEISPKIEPEVAALEEAPADHQFETQELTEVEPEVESLERETELEVLAVTELEGKEGISESFEEIRGEVGDSDKSKTLDICQAPSTRQTRQKKLPQRKGEDSKTKTELAGEHSYLEMKKRINDQLKKRRGISFSGIPSSSAAPTEANSSSASSAPMRIPAKTRIRSTKVKSNQTGWIQAARVASPIRPPSARATSQDPGRVTSPTRPISQRNNNGSGMRANIGNNRTRNSRSLLPVPVQRNPQPHWK